MEEFYTDILVSVKLAIRRLSYQLDIVKEGSQHHGSTFKKPEPRTSLDVVSGAGKTLLAAGTANAANLNPSGGFFFCFGRYSDTHLPDVDTYRPRIRPT